jgi:hypothetical protein
MYLSIYQFKMSFGCLVCKMFECCEVCMCVQAVVCYVYVLIYNSRVNIAFSGRTTMVNIYLPFYLSIYLNCLSDVLYVRFSKAVRHVCVLRL